jgi:hypothetical protein
MEGQSDVDLPLQLVATYTHKAAFRLEETGAGTKTLDLGSLGANSGPGAKFVLVYINPDTSSAAIPVLVGFDPVNSPNLEVSQGGWICVASPKPTTAGILTLKLAWTTGFKGYIWVLG